MRLEHANPRYAAYCIANGAADTEEMWQMDGNQGIPFMLWNERMLSQWKEQYRGQRPNAGVYEEYHLSDNDHPEYTAWLLGQAREVAQQRTRLLTVLASEWGRP